MGAQLAVTFTGLRFENPFLLSSAPPTESDSNIMRAFDAGWGGVVTKTIGLHPVVNVAGPKTKFLRATPDSPQTVDAEAPGHRAALVVELGAHLRQAARLVDAAHRDGSRRRIPNRILVASIMAGSGSDRELAHWQTLAKACQDEGADALELNLSCPHMDRKDMGSNIGKDTGADLDRHARSSRKSRACRCGPSSRRRPPTSSWRRAARSSAAPTRSSSSNTFPSLPLIDPETLEFEMNVDGYVSSGGLGGPAILPQSLAKMAQLTQAFPDKAFSGIGGVADFAHALNYFLLGCGTVQVCTAAMLDHAIGPNVIRRLLAGMQQFSIGRRRGWSSLEDFRGLRRDRVVTHSQIRRPDTEGVPRRPRRRGLRGQAARVEATATGRTEHVGRLRRAHRGCLRQPALESRPRADAARRSGPGPPTTSPRSGSA